MKKKLSTLAILASMSASLAFAGERAKPAATPDETNAPATAVATNNNSSGEQNPCVTTKQNKKTKNHNKAEPTDQEKEFDRVLMGIFG